MNKVLDIVAKAILAIVVTAIVGLIGFAFYQHPDIILPMIGSIGGIMIVVWAANRLML